jgi:hypothetical protein
MLAHGARLEMRTVQKDQLQGLEVNEDEKWGDV